MKEQPQKPEHKNRLNELFQPLSEKWRKGDLTAVEYYRGSRDAVYDFAIGLMSENAAKDERIAELERKDRIRQSMVDHLRALGEVPPTTMTAKDWLRLADLLEVK